MDRKRKKDIIILMGDLNVKIGDDNSSFEETMGKHGLGRMNENGEMFANFCASNQLIIGGSIFQHKRVHKATWISPDHRTANQIDHICIDKKFRTSLQDVKVCRGADVASDHHLLLSKIRLKLKRYSTNPNYRKQFKVEELKNQEVRDRFAVTVSNKYQVLEQLVDDMNIEEHWQQIKNIWKDTCSEVLGDKERKNKDWITTDTVNLIKERKNRKADLNRCKTRGAKAKAYKVYGEANKKVKQNIRRDKIKYIEELADEAEEAAEKGNMRDLYNITRKLTGKYKQSSGLIKDKRGNVISNTKEQMKRWKEHFEELLNMPKPQVPPEIEPAEEELQINCERPSKEEIMKAIKNLKDRKATGPDNIPAEAIKADKDISTELLYNLLGKIWEREEIPVEWKEGHLIKLPKKGDMHECTNYRGIMLLSVPGKILNRIILDRLKEAIDKQLREEQAGFRKNRSCTDQIATLRIIVEQSLEWNSPLYIGFVDYEKAFDSLDRESLWKLLMHYGVPPKIANLIKETYEGMKCRVIHEGQLTESFEIRTGVRQGCLLSPFLFLLAIDWIMKSTTDNRGGIQWTLMKQLEDLDFADDLALLSHNHAQIKDKMNILNNKSQQLGLKIHRGKTKVMRINAVNVNQIMLEETALQDVESYTYLGSNIDTEGGTNKDVKIRIQKARGNFIALSKIWKAREIKTNTKLRIFQSNVKSVLFYG